MGSRATARFTLLLVGVLAALLGIQVAGLAAQRSADRAASSRVALARDVEQIRYYDELLTMSARLAAASGDTSYVDRYQRAVPELDRVLQHALGVVPDAAASSAVHATDRANQALIALEERDFALLTSGDRAGAYAAVTSPQYNQLKTEYRSGMDRALQRLERAGAQQGTRATRRQQLSLAVGVAAAVLLAALWAATARGLRRSQHARGRVEEQLRVQAHADPLTGLPNRRRFREHLIAVLQPGPGPAQSRGSDPLGVAVLFADLDHFKTVNDTYGHADGDALLIEVAERLTDLLHGHPAALVARLGGDEFAVLLPHTHEAAAEQLADRLVDSLSRPYAAARHVPVTASVGLAVTTGQPDPGELLRGADLAMYDAKTSGRGRWSRFAEHMHTDLVTRVELESQLREGLHRGELVVHYQPIYHLRTGSRYGIEALVRWQHPQHGLLLPAAFVPLAERSDLILALGHFVLEQACRQLAAWRTELGPSETGGTAPAQVAVNVSPRELNQPGYAAQVLAILHLTGLPARHLVLEVTESTVMTDQHQVVDVLTDLRAAGVRITIDDFGTGHSSLARLHELPIDQIKIDRSFITAAAPAGDDNSHPDTHMLELLVALAGRLDLDLVAEGIETTHQLEAVRDTGCTYGQGYLLGRPQPPERTRDEPHTTPTGSHPGARA